MSASSLSANLPAHLQLQQAERAHVEKLRAVCAELEAERAQREAAEAALGQVHGAAAEAGAAVEAQLRATLQEELVQSEVGV
jgi:hypothetical protein